MRPNPSEVWSFKSPTLPNGDKKFKHHLCIGTDGVFLFVSTHRKRREDHRGVIVIPNSDVPFLPDTETQQSEISCTTIIKRSFPDPRVPRNNPRGTVVRRLMRDVLCYVRKSRQLTADERDAILDCIYDYYGADLG
jgi:hypothetical protein